MDLAADLKPELKRDFYVDAMLIGEAVSRGRAANLIYLETVKKFDLFPLHGDEYKGG